MSRTNLICWSAALVCLLSVLSLAQAALSDEIVANQNRVAAGKLENSTLNVQLELRSGTWHAEAEDGQPLFVQAIAETGHSAQIPGPMLRVPEGTTVHARVTNNLKMKATIYGLNTRPCDPNVGIEIAPAESHEFTFLAGAPGTYYYWARTTEPLKSGNVTRVQPLRADAQMNGAFIVDPSVRFRRIAYSSSIPCSYKRIPSILPLRFSPSMARVIPTQKLLNIPRARRFAGA